METRHHRISVKKACTVPYFYINYDGVNPEEATIMLQALIDDMKEHKLPFIANFKGLKITPKYLVKANEWIAATKNIVPSGAFIGFDNTHMVIFEAIKSINKFEHKSYHSLESAENDSRVYYASQYKQ